MSIEAMKLALEALKFGLHVGFDESSESQIKKSGKAFDQHNKAITALRTAIAEAEGQEPVAWMSKHDVGFIKSEFGATPTVPLYTTPPAAQRQWVGLTDAELADMHATLMVKFRGCYETKDLYKAIEAKLKEMNNG
jgi:hypothetical protein